MAASRSPNEGRCLSATRWIRQSRLSQSLLVAAGRPCWKPVGVTVSEDDDDHLDRCERCARHRLDPILGPLRIVDRPGGPQGVHDFEADLADGLVAAVEVTSEVDSERLDQAASTEHHISSLTVTNSQRRWLVALAEGASVKTIKHHLPQSLSDLEISGRVSTYGIDDYFDPVAQRLAALKIESVHAVQAKAGRGGTVHVQPGTYVGSAWDGRKIDEWLESLLASSRGVKKLEKLDRSGAAQRHLVIVLDPFSAAGLGIALGFTARQDREAADHVIPSLSPPKPLRNLWILPSFDTWEGLAWAPESRWTILPASRTELSF
jgi:hypothetical protein